jgi:NAD(P)-dependent dehydrogenase (short-subunit alcohol dehydrogenase family)
MRFSGKSAIVTGAASGIGKHLALALAREGAGRKLNQYIPLQF